MPLSPEEIERVRQAKYPTIYPCVVADEDGAILTSPIGAVLLCRGYYITESCLGRRAEPGMGYANLVLEREIYPYGSELGKYKRQDAYWAEKGWKKMGCWHTCFDAASPLWEAYQDILAYFHIPLPMYYRVKEEVQNSIFNYCEKRDFFAVEEKDFDEAGLNVKRCVIQSLSYEEKMHHLSLGLKNVMKNMDIQTFLHRLKNQDFCDLREQRAAEQLAPFIPSELLKA